MAAVEWFKKESLYGLSAKKTGRCREVAVSAGLTVVFYLIVEKYVGHTKRFPVPVSLEFYSAKTRFLLSG